MPKRILLSVLLLSVLFAEARAGGEPAPVQVAGFWDDLKEKATSVGSDLSEDARETATSIGEGIDGAQDWAAEKVEDFLNGFSEYGPVFREAGFEMTELSIVMGLIPDVSLRFKQMEEITPEQQQALLDKYADKIMLSAVLSSLFRVHELELGDYKIKETIVSLTIPPRTRVILRPKPAAEPAG